MTDFLDEKREEIRARIDELKPHVDEYARLQDALKALGGGDEGASERRPPARPRRGPGRPRGSGAGKPAAAKAGTRAKAAKRAAKPPASTKAAGKGRATGVGRGRKKGTGSRAAQTLAGVQAKPGITIPELATQMGIKQNYLYRVLPGLEDEKKVRKEGRGWHPVAGTA